MHRLKVTRPFNEVFGNSMLIGHPSIDDGYITVDDAAAAHLRLKKLVEGKPTTAQKAVAPEGSPGEGGRDVEETPVSRMNLTQLKAKAKELGLTVGKDDGKADLQSAIREHLKDKRGDAVGKPHAASVRRERVAGEHVDGEGAAESEDGTKVPAGGTDTIAATNHAQDSGAHELSPEEIAAAAAAEEAPQSGIDDAGGADDNA